MAKRSTDGGDVAILDPMTDAAAGYIDVMPPQPTRTAIPQQQADNDPSEVLAQIKAARDEAEAMKPVETVPLQDLSMGRPDRPLGGLFCLKKLLVANVNNIDVNSPGGPRIIDRAKCRELRVPITMGRPYDLQGKKDQTIKLIAPCEVVMEGGEERYASERIRDRILSSQMVPETTDAEGNVVPAMTINLGPIDWARLNQGGGNAGLGKAGLSMSIK